MAYGKDIKNKGSARDARDTLLSRAPEVIKCLIDTSLGYTKDDEEGDPSNEPNLEALLEITKKLIPIIKLEDDREVHSIECEMDTFTKEDTAHRLLKMQLRGDISLSELDQAMLILKNKFEIEELGDVLAQLEALKDK